MRVVDVRVETVAGTAGNVVTLATNRAGDFSTYTLRIVTSPVVDEVPDGFDPLLSSVDFSFKVDCDSDFDCRGRTRVHRHRSPRRTSTISRRTMRASGG